MPKTLRQARCLFTQLISEHVLDLIERGYEVAYGEGMDRKTEKDPTSDHMTNSLHNIGLAQDLDLYLAGVYLTRTEDHKASGDLWKQRHPLCRWGGDFSKPDGNHYSIAWEGKA